MMKTFQHTVVNMNQVINNTEIQYCFLTLYRADKSASGLAFRMPILWEELSSQQKCRIYLIINESLYNRTLKTRGPHKNVFLIPELLGFKLSCLLLAPLYLIFIYIKGCRKFHMSAGGAYFLKPFSKIKNQLKISLHSSFGSKSIEMASNGKEKYKILHKNLIDSVDLLDCLYSNNDLFYYAAKIKIAPCSFSWRYTQKKIIEIASENYFKNNSIVFSGTLISQKNYIFALNGFEHFLRLKNKKSKVQFFIIAPYATENFLLKAKKINEMAQYEAVKFVNQEKADSVYKSGFIFLSLQSYDNYPSQSLIESMIYGCTIIATDVGDTRKLVRPENGNILIPESIEDLSHAINKALKLNPFVNQKNQMEISNNHSLRCYSDYFAKNFIFN